MAALYGRMTGNRGEVTRMGSKASGIESTLETWQGQVKTVLEANGDFAVYVGPKRSSGTVIVRGNVGDSDEGRWAQLILNGKHSTRQSIDEGAGVVARVENIGTKKQTATTEV